MTKNDCAAFFLPGLIHQFGNILLTVQGNLMHLDVEDLERTQVDVLGAAKRGSGSLKVMRCLVNAGSSDPASGSDLLRQVVELGYVAARERGVALSLGEDDGTVVWVPSMPFVQVCAHTITSWVAAIPVGTEGQVHIAGGAGADGRFVLEVGFESASGSLPFSVDVVAVGARLEQALQQVAHEVAVEPRPDVLKVSVAPSIG